MGKIIGSKIIKPSINKITKNKLIEIIKEEYEKLLTEGNGYDVTLTWSGLRGKDAEIGNFTVSKNTYDTLNQRFEHSITFDLYTDDSNNPQIPLSKVIDIIKKSKYGKISFIKKT